MLECLVVRKWSIPLQPLVILSKHEITKYCQKTNNKSWTWSKQYVWHINFHHRVVLNMLVLLYRYKHSTNCYNKVNYYRQMLMNMWKKHLLIITASQQKKLQKSQLRTLEIDTKHLFYVTKLLHFMPFQHKFLLLTVWEKHLGHLLKQLGRQNKLNNFIMKIHVNCLLLLLHVIGKERSVLFKFVECLEQQNCFYIQEFSQKWTFLQQCAVVVVITH